MQFIRILATLIILMFSSHALSENWAPFDLLESKNTNEVWLNAGFYSYHFDRHQKLNDNNIGIGVEYRYSTISAITAGGFHNSNFKISTYLSWHWQPLTLGPTRIGVLLGAINGYPHIQDGNYFPLILPIVSYEYKNIGFNLTLIPPYPNLLFASVTLQIKLKVF